MPFTQFHQLLLVILTTPLSTSFPHTCKSSSLTNLSKRLSRNGPMKPFYLFRDVLILLTGPCSASPVTTKMSMQTRSPPMSVSVQTPASPQRLSQSMQMTNPSSQKTSNTNSLQKNYSFKNSDKNQYKVAKYEAEKAIRRAKAQYRNKLEKRFSTSNSHAVWQGLQQITQHKQKPIPANNDPTLPHQLNHFYSRFDRKNTTKASSHSVPPDSDSGLPLPPFTVWP